MYDTPIHIGLSETELLSNRNTATVQRCCACARPPWRTVAFSPTPINRPATRNLLNSSGGRGDYDLKRTPFIKMLYMIYQYISVYRKQNSVLTAAQRPYSVAVPVSSGGRLHSAPAPINHPTTPHEIY